jgi:hypothetical protein
MQYLKTMMANKQRQAKNEFVNKASLVLSWAKSARKAGRRNRRAA